MKDDTIKTVDNLTCFVVNIYKIRSEKSQLKKVANNAAYLFILLFGHPKTYTEN